MLCRVIEKQRCPFVRKFDITHEETRKAQRSLKGNAQQLLVPKRQGISKTALGLANSLIRMSLYPQRGCQGNFRCHPAVISNWLRQGEALVDNRPK